MYKTPRMNDGRSVNGPDNNKLNENILNHYRVQSNWDYRQLLQKQGLEFMNHNFQETLKQNGNYVNTSNKQSAYKSPYIFHSFHEIPITTSDLQLSYLTNQSNQARLISPSIPTTN